MMMVMVVMFMITATCSFFMMMFMTAATCFFMVMFFVFVMVVMMAAWKQFDLVPQEYEVRESAADYTGRLCVIGTDLKEDELTKLFHL